MLVDDFRVCLKCIVIVYTVALVEIITVYALGTRDPVLYTKLNSCS